MRKLFLLKILFLILAAGNLYSQCVIIPTGAKTMFDIQAKGSACQIIQDRNNPDYIHAVYMYSPFGDTTFTGRTIQYLLSTNRGASWQIVNSIPLTGSDYPYLSLLSSGAPIISFNYTVGSFRKILTYTDRFPGLGSFVDLGTPPCGGAYPVMIASENINLEKKFHVLSSSGFSSGLSLTSASYTPCVPIADIFGFSDKCVMAKGMNGKIGIAFISDLNPGDVYLMESPDNGVTFGKPLKIFEAEYSSNKTFSGAYKGISLVYNNNTPNIVFETAKQSVGGEVFQNKPGAIMHWSPLLAGTDPYRSQYIARNDSGARLNFLPFYKTYEKEEFSSLCRPSIGVFSDSLCLAVVFMASASSARSVNGDTAQFNNIYYAYTSNKGLSWKKPKKLNSGNEIRDWTYPSISPYNYCEPGSNYFANIICTKDSIPGSNVNNPSLGKSLAEQEFIKALIKKDEPESPVMITSGTIKYNDNNAIVTNGIVKALRFNDTTGQVVVTASAPIDANGNYSLNFDPPFNTHYIVAYPNSENDQDFVATFYPQTIDWQNAQTVNSGENNPDINIGVYRKSMMSGKNSLSGTVIKNIMSLNPGLAGAYVYLKLNNNFVSFTETDKLGNFTLINLPNNNYKIIATKLGYSTIIKDMPVNSSLDTISFSLSQILIAVYPVSNEIPKNFNLYQNYPNPFNPATKIKFDVNKFTNVSIKIYNLLGKEISVLLNEIKQPGSYIAEFNAENLPSGIYFYRITASTYTETKRMVIVK